MSHGHAGIDAGPVVGAISLKNDTVLGVNNVASRYFFIPKPLVVAGRENTTKTLDVKWL